MTNKLVLRSTEEFMTGYRPAYNPIMPLFLSNSQQYAVEVGKLTFVRTEVVGDIRSKMIGPKDTEIHQIHAKEGKKEFKKYFFGSQFVQSNLQDSKDYEGIVSQVLDEHNKQSDSLLMTGEGTTPGTAINNGLFYSTDANYVNKASYEVQKDAGGDHLADLFTKMVSIHQESDDIDGRKIVLVYGPAMVAKYNSLFVETKNAFATTLAGALPGTAIAKIPTAITPAGKNGFIVVNLDQVKLHYTLLPAIQGQGINAEKMYAWTNFLMGSCMMEVLASAGIIKQEITFQV